MGIWSIVFLFSVCLLSVAAIYTLVRWRRAPAALRGISVTGAACFVAGLLFGMWLFHKVQAGPGAAARRPAKKGVDRPFGSVGTKLVALGPHGVQVYDLTGKGDARIVASIAGKHTGMSQSDFPTDIDMDNHGDIYVLQGPGSDFHRGSTVLEFSAGSSGDVSPARIIGGPATSLLGGRAITVAPDGSEIFVASACGSGPAVSCIVVFGSKANGNSKPHTRITFAPGYGCSTYGGLTLDPEGNLWVADGLNNCISEVRVDAHGTVMPIATLWGPTTGLAGPDRLAFDTHGRLYVANRRGPSITVYKPGSREGSAPVASIFGPRTGLADPCSVAVDARGTIYVEDGDRLVEFKAGSNGDVSPDREIRISNLGFPSTIIVLN
jgi:hypothetical protein